MVLLTFETSSSPNHNRFAGLRLGTRFFCHWRRFGSLPLEGELSAKLTERVSPAHPDGLAPVGEALEPPENL